MFISISKLLLLLVFQMILNTPFNRFVPTEIGREI